MRLPLLAILITACAAPPESSPPARRNPVVQVRAHRSIDEGTHRRVHTQVGSGFVVDDRGHVVTSRHVIAFPDNARATVTVVVDGEFLNADVARFDAGGDLALLRIAPQAGLRPLTLGDRKDIVVGRPVRVQGFPGPGPFRETRGVITAYEPSRRGGLRRARLECDASIRMGSSGGPVLTEDGAVIGVVVEEITRTGIARAVPVDYLARRLFQWDVR